MQSTPIVRPSWLSRYRSSFAGVLAASAAALVIGHAMTREAPTRTNYVPLPFPAPIPTVVTVPVTTIPPQEVHVSVEPPATEEVAEEHLAKVRALAPTIAPTCIAPMFERDADGISGCEWDDGIPAISEDGMRIVTWVRTGEADVAMAFIDTQTSRVVRKERLVAKGEMENYTVKPAAHARVRARVAALQKELDGGKFRSLIEPVRNNPMLEVPRPREVVAEYATYELAARLVDGTTNVQLWRGEFHDDEHCAQEEHLSIWWDPPTRNVFITVTYARSEECPTHEHHFVQKASAP